MNPENKKEENKYNKVNIFLNSLEEKNENSVNSNNINAYEKYVIVQNDTLLQKNAELHNENMELKKHIDTLEDENERMEKGTRYMKGLLKNFSELDKLRIELDKRKSDLCLKSSDIHKSYVKDLGVDVRIIECIISVIMLFGVYLNIFNILFFTIGTVFITYLEKNKKLLDNLQINDLLNLSKNKKLMEIEKSIKEITDAYDFIYECIDNV